jgi:Protein of unknown function (DUF2934)
MAHKAAKRADSQNSTGQADPVAFSEGPFSEQITALAYALWQERGCPDGNPEEDWFRAEQELRTKQESQSEIVHALSRVRRNRRVSQAAQA